MPQSEATTSPLLRGLRPTKSTVVLTLAIIVALSGVTFAAIPDAGGKVYLCYSDSDAKKNDGGATVRIIDKDVSRDDCDGKKELVLNAKGQPGGPGPAGPPGPMGPAGTGGGDAYGCERIEMAPPVECSVTVPAGSYTLTPSFEGFVNLRGPVGGAYDVSTYCVLFLMGLPPQ